MGEKEGRGEGRRGKGGKAGREASGEGGRKEGGVNGGEWKRSGWEGGRGERGGSVEKQGEGGWRVNRACFLLHRLLRRVCTVLYSGRGSVHLDLTDTYR